MKNDNTEEKYAYLGIFFSILIIVFITILTIDMLGSGYITANLTTKADCDYELPSHMRIVTNGDKYIIAVEGSILGTEYLYNGGSGEIYEFIPKISKPTMFWSECKARGFAKKYVEQQYKKQQGAWDDSEFINYTIIK